MILEPALLATACCGVCYLCFGRLMDYNTSWVFALMGVTGFGLLYLIGLWMFMRPEVSGTAGCCDAPGPEPYAFTGLILPSNPPALPLTFTS